MSDPTEYRSKTRAIMFSDIKGYSRLMGENESVALALLDEHNRIVVPRIEANGGTVLKFIGDAVLSTYESAADAVRCGIAIQKALSDRNAAAPADRQILIRIGIHVGDVVLKDNDAFGDGVNIAARIEPLAEPGGIAISQTVYDMVKARPEIQLVNLGPKELKNIKESVNIYKVLVEANRDGVVAPSKPPVKPTSAATSRLILAIAGVVFVALLGSIGWLGLHAKRTGITTDKKPEVAEAPVADVSPNKDATLAYKQGMQAFSDGASYIPLFKKALDLDAALAPATLQLALELRQRDVTQARANFRQTTLNRERLPEFDKALFAASDPYFADPPSLAEWEKRLTDLVTRYPKEARAGYYLGEARRLQGRFDDALTAYRIVHTAAPEFAAAYSREALVLRQAGHADEADATLDRCSQAAPYGIVCIVERANAASDAGQCDRFLEHARRAVSVSPDNFVSYMLLSMALQSTGGSVDSIKAALAQKRKFATDSITDLERADNTALAMLSGDFETVVRLGWESFANAQMQNTELSKLSRPAHWLAEAYEELGDMKRLAEISHRFLDAAGAFTPNTMSATGDLALAKLEFERDLVLAGEPSRADLDAARTAFLEAQVAAHTAPAIAWATGYGWSSLTRDDAVQAISAQTAFAAAPPAGWDPVSAQLAGKIKQLAGLSSEAIPLLEKSARACNALRYPHENTRAWFRLGQAREAAGDAKGAREAYEVVISRWGSAKSATAQEAKTRLAALAPAPTP